MAFGQPQVFALRPQSGSWGPLFSTAEPRLDDTVAFGASLERLVDFERLDTGPRYTATAVDLESGQTSAFDTRDGIVGADHFRASSALLPAFPPVEIDQRLFVDGGVAANLPLDPVLSAPPEGPTLCIALDRIDDATIEIGRPGLTVWRPPANPKV